MNSKNRAPEPSTTRGAIRGALGSWVRLELGLVRTKEKPTSVPKAPFQVTIDLAPVSSPGVGNAGGGLERNSPFHPLRVGNVGG